MIEVISGERMLLEELPAHFYLNGEVAFGGHDDEKPPRAFYFEEESGGVFLKKGSLAPNHICLLFGKDWEDDLQMQPNVEYLLQLNDQLYVFRFDCSSLEWIDRLDVNRWYLFDFREDTQGREFTFQELCAHIREHDLEWNHMGVSVKGMEGAFSLRQIGLMSAFRGLGNGSDSEVEGDDEAFGSGARIDVTLDDEAQIDINGPLLSPYCWERFDFGDIMHISVDERMMGGIRSWGGTSSVVF